LLFAAIFRYAIIDDAIISMLLFAAAIIAAAIIDDAARYFALIFRADALILRWPADYAAFHAGADAAIFFALAIFAIFAYDTPLADTLPPLMP